MEQFKLELHDGAGRKAELSEKELLFINTPPSLKKIYYSAFVVAKLLSHGHCAQVLDMAVGFARTVLLNKAYTQITSKQRQEIVGSIVGFSPTYATIRSGDMGAEFASQDAAELIISIYQIFVRNQYSLGRKNAKGRVIVDAGANLGVFSVYAAKLGAKRVYAFEPVKETYDELKANIRANGLGNVITPVNAALGGKSGKATIFYSCSGDGSASIHAPAPGKMRQQIDVTSIDSFMGGKGRVDFIKIDTEGCEREILLGARKTIRKFKPVLSFSAYHKPQDKKELPEIVRKLRPDYKCTLMKKAEEDFYCH